MRDIFFLTDISDVMGGRLKLIVSDFYKNMLLVINGVIINSIFKIIIFRFRVPSIVAAGRHRRRSGTVRTSHASSERLERWR